MLIAGWAYRVSVRDTPKTRIRALRRWRRLLRQARQDINPDRDRIRRMTTNYRRRQKGWKT